MPEAHPEFSIRLVYTALTIFDSALAALRLVLFVLAAVAFVVFALDWLVRTRRVNPFGSIAKFCRRVVDPVIMPVERRVVRAGGLPTSAPWWTLVTVVIGGILLILGLQFIRDMLLSAMLSTRSGSRGLYHLLVSWTIGILQLALIIRVLASWLRISEFKPWIRWTVPLTEWLLRPLRSIIPPFGMMDVSPIVAYFLLMLLGSVLHSIGA